MPQRVGDEEGDNKKNNLCVRFCLVMSKKKTMSRRRRGRTRRRRSWGELGRISVLGILFVCAFFVI